jgi:hypothetical protein
MQLPDRAAIEQWLRRPRSRVLLGVLALLVAVRIALPYVLRPIIVAQADKALVGRIALADLDLSLIRGGVTLHGLEVYADELPPPGTPVDPAKKPLFSAGRLWTQISWLQLLLKTIDVEEFELVDFAVRLDRLKDGLVLPKPAPSSEPEPPAPPPAAPETAGSGWAFAADSLALTRGSITFRDFTVGEAPQRFDLAIDNIAARKLALRFEPSGTEPGHVALEAELGGGGKIGYEADVETKQAGPAIHSKITLSNLPIGGVRVYLKMFGWSDLVGTLDAVIEHNFETAGAHDVSGTLSLSAVSVKVPELDRPAIRFDKLSVALDKIDVVKQHAAVADVALQNLRLVVDPKLPRLMPLLRAPKSAPPEPEPAPARDEPAAPAKPWTWSLARARLQAAQLDVLGPGDPLLLGVDAEIQKLASPAKGTSPVSLDVAERDGKLALKGAIGLEPLSFDGKLALHDFALPPLAARAPVAGGELLRGGKARADLAIALAPRSGVTPPTADLRVSGSLGLAGLAVGKAGDRDFAAGWKDFELQIKEVRVAPALGGDPAQPRAIDVALDLLRLVEPDVHLTRTEKGIALPELGGAAKPAEAKAEPAPEAAKPSAAAAPAPQIHAQLAKLRLESGRAHISDRSVKPFYEGRIEKLDVRARGVRYPGPEVDSGQIELEGLQGAKLFARFGVVPNGSTLNATLDGLLLAPFNPYVTPTGYAVSNGALSFKVKGKQKGDTWDSKTDLRIDQLEVGGSEGEALFQESFGIPLSMALGLLKDTEGAITLNVPVAGDRSGARVGLGSLAGQALRKALIGALASPLKLLGIGTADGKVANLAPQPVEFLPGSIELPQDSAARVEQLAALLAAAPAISLTLHGSSAAADERAMRERAILVELQKSSGFRALANLGSMGVRRAVRIYLEKRDEGATAELDPEASAWLEQKVGETTLEPGALDSLAQARAAALQQALVAQHGVGVDRVVVGEPIAGQTASVPGVTIDVGARASAAD